MTARMEGRPTAEDGHAGRARLPAAASDLAIRLGVEPQQRRSRVNLTQTGRIKRDLASIDIRARRAA